MNEAKIELYPLESPEAWQAVRTTAEKGDTPAVKAALEAMDLSPRLSKLFVAAVAEERELDATVAAGEGMAEKFVTLGEEIAFLLHRQPKTIEESRKQAEQQQQLRAERLAAERAVAAAKAAGRQRAWLRLWLPELFSEIPPPHAGPLSGLQPSPKTFDAATALGVANFYNLSQDSWRKVGEQQNEDRPKRKYTSFSPLVPKH